MQPSAAQKVVLADQAGDAEDDAGLLSVGEAPFSALIASLLALLRSPVRGRRAVALPADVPDAVAQGGEDVQSSAVDHGEDPELLSPSARR